MAGAAAGAGAGLRNERTMLAIFTLSEQPHLAALSGGQPGDLVWLADAPLVGHLVRHVAHHLTAAWFITPRAAVEPLTSWAAGRDWGFSIHVTPFSPDDSLARTFGEIRAAGAFAPEEPLYCATNQAIVIPDLGEVEQAGEVVLCGETALWLRRGRLLEGLNLPVGSGLRPDWAAAAPVEAAAVRPLKLLPVDTLEAFLEANSRLLGMGFSSADALERSYTEEFAVIPPVYIDPAAEIVASVIGPYAAIGPEAVVEDSIVRRSVVGRQAVVRDALLAGSIVGEGAVVTGRPQSLTAAAGQQIAIEETDGQSTDS